MDPTDEISKLSQDPLDFQHTRTFQYIISRMKIFILKTNIG